MSTTNYKTKRVSREEARKLIAKILQDYPASTLWSAHCSQRMNERDLTTLDVFNVLNSPHARVMNEGEPNKYGVYGYRMETNRMFVVVSFSSCGTKINVVTAARKEA